MTALLDDITTALDPDRFIAEAGYHYADHLGEDEQLIYRLAHHCKHSGDRHALLTLAGIDDNQKGIGEFLQNQRESSLAWAIRVAPLVRKYVRRKRFVESQLIPAAEGNVEALLAIPEARTALLEGKGILAYTTKRKAIAEAKVILAARDQRVADRKARDRVPQEGRILTEYQSRLRIRAIDIGEHYHRTVKRLYQSMRATVGYGAGGQEHEDQDSYSRSYRSRYGCAKWKNAGARLDSLEKPTCVIIENYRGTEVARVPFTRRDSE